VLLMSVFGAVAYLMMIVLDWQGRLVDESAAPASLAGER